MHFVVKNSNLFQHLQKEYSKYKWGIFSFLFFINKTKLVQIQ